MAEKYERYRRSDRESRLRLPTPAVEKEPTKYDPAKQVEGYERRLEASGIDVEKATDTRSFVEKTLNLTEDQNFLFDVFEVLGRPQQAIFNGIKAVQEGKSFGEGFASGLSGDNFVQFSEILNEAGFGEEDRFGVDDVIGFIGDVFLDPADLGIMAAGVAAAPLTGGGSLVGAGAAVAGANAAVDAGKLTQRVLKTLKKGAAASKDDLVKSMRNIGTRLKATGKTTARFYGDLGQNILKGEGKDIARKLFSRQTIKLSNGQTIRKIGMTDMTMQAFGQLLKKGGKAVNWTVRTGIIETFAKDADTYQKTWDNWLTAMKGQFNAAARLGDKLFTDAQIAANKASFGRLFGDAWVRKVNREIDDIVEATFQKQVAQGLDTSGLGVVEYKQQMREGILKELSQYAEHKLVTSTTASEVLNNPYKQSLPIDDKVRESVIQAINNPAYASIKRTISESATKGKLYERQVRKLSSQLALGQQSLIDDLTAERARLVPTGEVTDPAQAAQDFINAAGDRATPEELQRILSQGALDDATQARNAQDFIDAASRGATPEELQEILRRGQAANPNQARIAEIDRQIAEAQAKMDYYKTIGYNEAGYETIKREIREGINSGTLDAGEYEDALNRSARAIEEDGYNLFDELFEETVMEDTGKRVWVMRKGPQTDRIIADLNARAEYLGKLVNDEAFEHLRDIKRITQNSAVETQVRKLIRESNMKKTYDDIFELNGGVWTVVDQEAYQELLELARPMQSSFEGARFLTDEEIASLADKFQDGFENQEAYDSIINRMNSAMEWYDKRYGTTIKQDKPGYLRHAMTQEAKETLELNRIYKKQFGTGIVDDDTGVLLGNTKAFKGRKYDMSIVEANRVARFNTQRILKLNETGKFLDPKDVALLQEKATMNLFSEYFTDSMADTLIKMNEYGAAINVMNTALIGGVMDQKDVLRFTSDPKAVPAGFVGIEKSKLRNKLQQMSMVFKDNESMKRVIKQFLDNADGSVALIDENVFKMIGRLGEPKDVRLLTNLINKTNNSFKKLKVFSAGFHFKNLVGNMSNLYLAGVPPTKIPGMLLRGMNTRKIAIQSADLFADVAAGVRAIESLTPKQREIYEAYQIFLNGGFEDAGKYIQDLDELLDKQGKKHLSPKEMLKKSGQAAREGDVPGTFINAVDGLLQLNVDINNIVDGGYRLGYIMDLKKQGFTDAEIIQKVKLALFDPSSLTAAEDTFRKYIPFYTFAKKNLAFQMRNVFENPVQYSRFIKGVRSSWEAFGVDWQEDLQEYQRGNLWLPIPLTMKDGKYFQLKTSFPLSDLGEFVENPAQKLFSSLTPLARAPIELTMNQQFFTGQPIERFEGQAGRNLPGTSAKMEYFIGQTGFERLAAPVTNVINLLQNRDATAILPTVASQGDVETARRSAAYEQLDQLRGLFQYYKQEEIPILTIAEIENINKPRSTLSQRLQAIQAKRGQ